MKNWKSAMQPLCLVSAMLLASVCYGQTVTIFVGSSGAINSFGVSGFNTDPITSAKGPCEQASAAFDGGNPTTKYNLWTAKSSSTTFPVGVDSNRNAAFPDEPGNLWVEWDNSAAPTFVCAYLSVDSVVGNRLLFGTYAGGGHATFRFDNPLGTAADPAAPGGGGTCAGGTSQVGANNLPGYTDGDLTSGPGFTPASAYLPCTVYTALVGQQFTATVSDIRPEDAEYAAQRAAGTCAAGNCLTGGSKNTGLGYGGAADGLPGTAVVSGFTNTSAQEIGYYISGNDPASSVPVLGGGGYTVTNVGAYPVIWFVGLTPNSPACATDFVNNIPSNVPSHTLAFLYGGTFGANANEYSTLYRTTDLLNGTSTQSAADGGGGLNGCPMTIIQREAMSGTFNTVEWQILQAEGVGLSQEDYIDPTGTHGHTGCYIPPAAPVAPCFNPLFLNYANGSVRVRAIGTGEVIKEASGSEKLPWPAWGMAEQAPNAIGYGFWTFSTFTGQTNLRYLQLDGVDPINQTYVNGQFPTCPPLPCKVPFTNVINGGYRNWNVIRLIQPATLADNTAAGAPTAADETLATTIVAAGQDQADPTKGNLTDFVPFSDASGHILNVFRSHYNIPNIYQFGVGNCASCGDITAGALLNGTNSFAFGGQPAYADAGGDMAGAVFYDQNDMDYLNDFGNVITGWRQ